MNISTDQRPSIHEDDDLRRSIDKSLASIVGGIRHERLREAAEHSTLGGGKRIRPIITLRTALMLGGTIDDAMPAACAFELIHAFSLVHDDLPALDNDDMRRGKPTTHKAFGECVAILTGDLLQSLAFVSASETTHNATLITAEVANASWEMIEGQTWDTIGVFPEKLDEQASLELIHRSKTAALIRHSARAGAIAAEASKEDLAAVDRWGAAVGLMFQVVDDILDETQTTEQLGKTAGKDRAQGKMTYPAIHGIEGARSFVDSLENQAKTALECFDEAGEPLRMITSLLSRRTK
jgi:geranylgeranyl diphosphate synthase type II